MFTAVQSATTLSKASELKCQMVCGRKTPHSMKMEIKSYCKNFTARGFLLFSQNNGGSYSVKKKKQKTGRTAVVLSIFNPHMSESV